MKARSVFCLVVLGAILVFVLVSCQNVGSGSTTRTTTTESAEGVRTTVVESPAVDPFDRLQEKAAEGLFNLTNP